jgi:toxin ParE1/3/4
MPTEPPSGQTVQLHEQAAAEYDEAFDWYLSRSADSALRFDAEVERGIAHIASSPRRWPLSFLDTRKYLLTDFPFFLIYRESVSGVIQILAVAHTSRKPEYWKGRL